jgi:hypothetical protein
MTRCSAQTLSHPSRAGRGHDDGKADDHAPQQTRGLHPITRTDARTQRGIQSVSKP